MVYVGGLIILVIYCIMLTPLQKFKVYWYPMLGILFFQNYDNAYSFGLLYRGNAIIIIAFMLYLVILAVVGVVGKGRR